MDLGGDLRDLQSQLNSKACSTKVKRTCKHWHFTFCAQVAMFRLIPELAPCPRQLPRPSISRKRSTLLGQSDDDESACYMRETRNQYLKAHAYQEWIGLLRFQRACILFYLRLQWFCWVSLGQSVRTTLSVHSSFSMWYCFNLCWFMKESGGDLLSFGIFIKSPSWIKGLAWKQVMCTCWGQKWCQWTPIEAISGVK